MRTDREASKGRRFPSKGGFHPLLLALRERVCTLPTLLRSLRGVAISTSPSPLSRSSTPGFSCSAATRRTSTRRKRKDRESRVEGNTAVRESLASLVSVRKAKRKATTTECAVSPFRTPFLLPRPLRLREGTRSRTPPDSSTDAYLSSRKSSRGRSGPLVGGSEPVGKEMKRRNRG
jgi:hypothetical protein